MRTVLPFEVQGEEESSRRDLSEHDELYMLLPVALQEECKEHKHLWDYLCLIPLDEVSVPEYVEELKRSHGDVTPYNLIYPVGSGVFIHVFTDIASGRPNYIPIEPGLTVDLDEVSSQVEERLLDEARALGRAKSDDEKKEILLHLMDKICLVSPNGTGGAPARSGNGKDKSRRGRMGRGKADKGKVVVSSDQMVALKYRVIRDKVGMGVLQPVSLDSYIEDISCSGIGAVFLEHKVFKSVQSATTFESHEDLDDFVLRLSEQIRKPVTLRNPIVDATLPDGSRINIVFGREVSRRGSNFTIRKFTETPMSIMDLIGFGSLDYQMAAYLSMVIEEDMNLFVVGETASGKTTLLNAVTTFMPQNNKIISIEDTPELQVPHGNWIREVAKAPAPGDTGAVVTMFDLLKAALRQRPDTIIIGEIRGEEGLIAFGAMQTGHQVMSTFHASDVEKLIQRLTGHPISVPKTYVDNLNVVVCQNAVKLPNGKKGRRATSISEIVSFDPVTNTFSYVEIFRWNPANDAFDFVGHRNSHLLGEKIAIKRGYLPTQKWRICEVVERRAKILEKLHLGKGVTDFYELLKVLARAQKEGLF